MAANGRAAVEALEKENFHLMLMDIQRPGMDGFEATATIREKEKSTGKHIPIVTMTAHALKGDQDRCMAPGMARICFQAHPRYGSLCRDGASTQQATRQFDYLVGLILVLFSLQLSESILRRSEHRPGQLFRRCGLRMFSLPAHRGRNSRAPAGVIEEHKFFDRSWVHLAIFA